MRPFPRLWCKTSTGVHNALCLFVVVCALLCLANHGAAQTKLLLNSGATVTTAAGNGKDGAAASGAAVNSPMGSPQGLAYDGAGNLYIADARNHQLLKVTGDGTLTVIAGAGTQGYSGDGGPAVTAELDTPSAVVIASSGAVIFADAGSHTVRSIGTDGIVTTLAGTGLAGNTGDGAPAKAARLRKPLGLALAANGDLLIADSGNHRIRRVSGGAITALAGSGEEGDAGDEGPASQASLAMPTALLAMPDGSLLIADRAAHRIRSVGADGVIHAANAASLRRPEGLGSNAIGDLLVSDANLQQVMQSSASGMSAFAGSGEQGTSAATAALDAAMNSPGGLAVTAGGDVMVSDRGNHAVVKVSLPRMDFGKVAAGKTSGTQALRLQNGGAAPVQVTAITLPTPFSADSSAGSCAPLPFTLQAGAQCTTAVVFAPTAQGVQTAFAQVAVKGAAASAVLLSGTGGASNDLADSHTALQSDGAISYAGAPVSLSVTVAGSLLTPPAGNVIFYDGANAMSTVALTSGVARMTVTSLLQGSHTLKAVYSGDGSYATSTSGTVTQTVVATPDFQISAAAASYSGKASGTVTIPLTVLPLNGTLNHAVTLAVGGLPAGSTATFSQSALTLGSDPAAVSLSIVMPATLSSASPQRHLPMAAAALLLGLGLFPARRRRLISLLALGVCTVLLSGGCGGGFRTDAGGSSTTTVPVFNYTAVITASSTGVLGDTLVHTAPVGLVVTP